MLRTVWNVLLVFVVLLTSSGMATIHAQEPTPETPLQPPPLLRRVQSWCFQARQAFCRGNWLTPGVSTVVYESRPDECDAAFAVPAWIFYYDPATMRDAHPRNVSVTAEPTTALVYESPSIRVYDGVCRITFALEGPWP